MVNDLTGTLETYDNAALKCRRQQKKIDEKSAKVSQSPCKRWKLFSLLKISLIVCSHRYWWQESEEIFATLNFLTWQRLGTSQPSTNCDDEFWINSFLRRPKSWLSRTGSPSTTREKTDTTLKKILEKVRLIKRTKPIVNPPRQRRERYHQSLRIRMTAKL